VAPRRLARVVVVAAGFLACGAEVDLDRAYLEAEALYHRGHVEAARQRTRRAIDTLGPAPLAARGWRLRLLEAELLIELDQALAARLGLAGALPAALDGGELAARREKILGQAAAQLGDPAEAARRFEAAARLARAATTPALPIEITYRQAALLAEQGRHDEAERACRAVIDMETAAPEGARWRAAALDTLGRLSLARERWDEALTFLDPALSAARSLGAEALAARSLLDAGVSHARLGDFDRARQLLLEAAEIQRRLGQHAALPDTVGALGISFFLAGDAQQAAVQFERALALARQHAPRTAGRWASHLTTAYLALERWDAASRWNAEARALREGVGAPGDLAQVTLDEAAIARGRGDRTQAERLYRELLERVPDQAGVRWVARAGLASLQAADGRHTEAERTFREALAQVDDARADLGGVDRRLTLVDRLLGLHRAHVDWLIRRRRIGDALRAVERARHHLLTERLDRPDRLPPRAGGTGLPLRSRRRGEVLVSYWVTPAAAYAWVVGPPGTRLFRLVPGRELARAVDAYRTFIAQTRDDPRTLERSPAHALHDLVVRPLAAMVPRGSKVVIAADGPLHAVPFGALVTSGPRPRYWIEDVQIALAPSLASIATPIAGPRAHGPGTLLAIGNPEATRPEFPRLPQAEGELSALRRHFDSWSITTLTGDRARPEGYRESDPHRFSLIHFAARGVAHPASPLDSTLVLSHGRSGHRLSARDVLRTPLAADLVTVSASQGAGSPTAAGEALVGFAAAFLAAGARQVVAGLWEVADASTANLMDHLYAEIARGADPAAALRAAQLGLLRSNGRWRAPHHWAGFRTYLGPGPAPAGPRRSLVIRRFISL
jgi:CHAT domain-containing protein